jgi:hypothetical protein
MLVLAIKPVFQLHQPHDPMQIDRAGVLDDLFRAAQMRLAFRPVRSRTSRCLAVWPIADIGDDGADLVVLALPGIDALVCALAAAQRSGIGFRSGALRCRPC